MTLRDLNYEQKLASEEYVLKMNIQDIVKIPEWQTLRTYFVGKWKTQPEKNLKMLKEFAGDLTKLSNRRLRIVQNYVTGSGFRIGKISSDEITKFTEEVRNEVAARKSDGRWK
jgi:hypothetical protein